MTLLQRILILALLLPAYENTCSSDELKKTSIFTYGGVSTTSPLINILKVSVPELGTYSILTFGASRTFYQTKYISLGVEAQLSKHWENSSSFSFGSVFMFRWLVAPWDRFVKSTFGFGSGLSYSTEPLEVETSAIGTTSRLLFHMIIEFEFYFTQQSPWSAFIRDHHRSGVFGVFDGVTGGSDFLCLGMRYHF